MGMKFTVEATADIQYESNSKDGIDADDLLNDAINAFGYGQASFENATVESVDVRVSARVTVSDIEVSASDMDEFDAEQAVSEALDNGDVTVSGGDFNITDEPTGFSAVEGAVGRESAILVYAALDSNGNEVS